MEKEEKAYQSQYEVVEDAILSLRDIGDRAVEIRGVPTGIEGLDNFFYYKDRKRKNKSGAIRRYSSV